MQSVEKRKEVIHAVHENYLETYLDTLGLLVMLQRGELRCSECGEILSKENIGAVYPQYGDIKLSCDKPSCLCTVIEKHKPN